MTTIGLLDEPVAEVFATALRGAPCDVMGLGPAPSPVPVQQWRETADASDRALLAHCVGPTLDIGCGPGRMSGYLASTGQRVLGLDVVPEAVAQTRGRGVAALHRDVFSALPGEGRWGTALLADGNIGIGGDPARLLRRLHELLAPDGRVVVDLAPHGAGLHVVSVRLRTPGRRSHPFPWAVVGVEAIAVVCDPAGLRVVATHDHDGRRFAVLEKV